MTIGSGLKYEGAVKPSSIEKDGYEPALYASRQTEIPSNMQKRFAWSGSNCTYMGAAARGLGEGIDGWLLQKFTYNGSDQCTKIEIAYGNWTNHESASYG